MPTIYRRTSVTDADGVDHVYEPGDDVPDTVAERIDNPTVWEKPEDFVEDTPFGTSETFEDVSRPPADAPYATPGPSEPFQPDSGPVTEDGGNELTGEEAPLSPAVGSSAGVAGGSQPSQGDLDRMTKSELEDVARSRGIEPPAGATKAELRSLIDSADTPGEPEPGF